MSKYKNIILSILAVVIFVVSANIANAAVEHYDRDARVIEVNGDEIIAEDWQGYTWTFFGDGCVVGDRLTLKMARNNTPEIFDDIVTDYPHR